MGIKMNGNSLSIKEKIKTILAHPGFFLIVRLVIAAVFIYASMDKIFHPAAFAETVYRYQILPDFFVPWAALVQPWVELLVGVLLIAGFWLPGAVGLLNLLLLAFTGAILFNALRGLNIDCGCFESSGDLVSSTTVLLYLLRNLGFLCLSLYLAGYLVRKKSDA